MATETVIIQPTTLLGIFQADASPERSRLLLENLLAAGAYELPVCAVFLGSSIQYLARATTPEEHRQRAPFAALPLYDVAPVYALQSQLDLIEPQIQTTGLLEQDLRRVLASARFVVSA